MIYFFVFLAGLNIGFVLGVCWFGLTSINHDLDNIIKETAKGEGLYNK